MFHWRVILLAALAVVLMLGGLAALIAPEVREGPVLYAFDEHHAVRALDALGALLVTLGCGLSWGAGVLWQRLVYAP